jgi:hypothetical protein
MDTQFIVFPQEGSTLQDNTICGEHDLYSDAATGNLYVTANVDYPRLGCYATTGPSGMTSHYDHGTSVASHEYAEAVTDPDLHSGFRAPNGNEIGDKCNLQAGTDSRGLYVQTEYDNLSASCRMDADGSTTGSTSARIGTVHVTPTADQGIQQPGAHYNMDTFEITTKNAAGPGQLRIFPWGEPSPQTTDITLVPGQIQTHYISVALGYQGFMEITTNGTTSADVTIDYLESSLDGYYAGSADTHAINPIRVADSRSPTPGCDCGTIPAVSVGYARVDIGTNGQQTGIAAGSNGFVVNITAISPAATGTLTAYPSLANTGGTWPPFNPGPPPGTTSLTFAQGQTVANDVVLGPAKDAAGKQYAYFAIYNDSGSPLNYLVDLLAYSTTSVTTQSPVSPATPLEDSQNCALVQGSLCAKLAAGTVYSIPVKNRTDGTPYGGMPKVFAHLITLNSAGAGYLKVWNPDQTQPGTSLNQEVPGALVHDSTYVPVSAGGYIDVYSSVATDLIVELQGWGGP